MIGMPSLLGAPSSVALAVSLSAARATAAATATSGGTPAPTTPVNTLLPAITGTVQEGQILSVSNGSWSNAPTSYTYQWRRGGIALAGSINASRTLTSADVGAAMSCVVTATNAAGSTPAATANTAAVIAASVPVPVNTVAPAVTGTGTVGQVLTTDNGTWSNSPTSYTYAWRRDGVDIAGATSQTYTLVSADAGKAVTCRVFATNAGGTAGATSNLTAVAGTPTIAFANPTATIPEGNAGTSTVSNTINVTRNGFGGPLTINLTYGGTATSGTDYLAGPASVTVADGQSSLSFDLTINGDTTVEADETIIINAALSGYPATASKVITLVNDDAALAITGSQSTATVGQSTPFAPTVSGGSAPYTVAQSGYAPAGRSFDGSSETGTFQTPGTFSRAFTATDSAAPPASAILTVKTAVAGVVGDEAAMSPLPTTARATYEFAETGRSRPKPDAMATSFGPYYPSINDVRTDPFWQPLGITFICHYSTDHDAAASGSGDGPGGIWLDCTKSNDPTDASAWLTYDAALAAGWFAGVTTQPAGNPVFLHSPAPNTQQTETPCVRKVGSTWVMTYQTQAISGSRNQCTNRVLSTDGLNWTGTKTAPLLQVSRLEANGNGHTGYMRWGPNPFSVYPFTYIGYSLTGGTDRSVQGIWGTNDPVAGAWTFIENLISQSGRLTSDRVGFTGLDVRSIAVVRQGVAVVGEISTVASGAASRVASIAEHLIGPNGYDYIGFPNILMTPSLGAGPLSASNQAVVLPEVITLDDKRVMIFQGQDDFGTNSHKNNISVASSARRNKQNTYFTPLQPAIPTSLTERKYDFRTASALPAGLSMLSGSVAPTFDSNGMNLTLASASTAPSGFVFADEIPAGVAFVDFFLQDVKSALATCYRTLRIGIMTAPTGTALSIDADNAFWRTGGSGNSGMVKGYTRGGSVTQVDAARYPLFGFGNSNIGQSPKHIGMRWYVNTGQLFLLGEGKSQWGIEFEEVTLHSEFKPGGAKYGRPMRPFFGIGGIANSPAQEVFGALRIRYA